MLLHNSAANIGVHGKEEDMKQMCHEHINTALLSSIHGDTVTA